MSEREFLKLVPTFDDPAVNRAYGERLGEIYRRQNGLRPDQDVPGTHTARWHLKAFSQVTPRQTRWLVPGLIPLRYLTLVAGVGGLGKSTWLFALAAKGSIAPEPWDTVYVSFEDTAEEVITPRLIAANADLERVHGLVPANAKALDAFTLPRDIDELQKLVHHLSARLVVIDPVVPAIDSKLDAYKDQHVRQVLAQLWRISEEEDCAIALVGHLNRVPSTDAYLRIGNSTAFWNAARSVVLITEDGDDADDLRLITQRKANLARLAPIERHQLEQIILPDTFDPETGDNIVTSRMTFVEIAADVNRSDVLGPQKVTKTETAETLLEALLADGDWHESRGLRRLLEAAGFDERLSQRAAKELGVEYERRGFPSSTWWRLPVTTPPVATNLRPLHVVTEGLAQPSHLETLSGPSRDSRDSHDISNGAAGTDLRFPLVGDSMYPVFIAARVKDGHLTHREANAQYALHRFVARSRE